MSVVWLLRSGNEGVVKDLVLRGWPGQAVQNLYYALFIDFTLYRRFYSYFTPISCDSTIPIKRSHSLTHERVSHHALEYTSDVLCAGSCDNVPLGNTYREGPGYMCDKTLLE